MNIQACAGQMSVSAPYKYNRHILTNLAFGGYAPKSRKLWDPWIVRDDSGKHPKYWLYHLDAAQSVESKDDLDRQTVIRRAFSTDLQNWTDAGIVLGPGNRGSWDDLSIWSGSTVIKEGTHYLFYTGLNQRDGQAPEKVQRIGLAKSTDDGRSWQRSTKPLLEADSRWYETTEPSSVVRAFRDPWVVKDPKTGQYLMFFTAKTKQGPLGQNACIGLAIANTIEGPYTVQPPVLTPDKFSEMEVANLIEKDNKYYLFFSTITHSKPSDASGSRSSGLYGYVADTPRGPYRPLNGSGRIEMYPENLYSVKLIKHPTQKGQFVAYGWQSDVNNLMQSDFTLKSMIPVSWQGEQVIIGKQTD